MNIINIIVVMIFNYNFLGYLNKNIYIFVNYSLQV